MTNNCAINSEELRLVYVDMCLEFWEIVPRI